MKLPKKLWYEDQLWDIVKIHRPTRYDTYILCKRVDENHIHPEGDAIHPVEMCLIDCGNDTFMFDSPKVLEIMKKRLKALSSKEKSDKRFDNQQNDIWLDDFRRVNPNRGRD